VGAGAVYVTLGLAGDAVALAPLQQGVAVLGVADHILALPLHEDTLVLVLPDVQGVLLVGVLEQVVQLLVVYLKEGAVGCELTLLCAYLLH
jgi:hypothetical protein